MLKKYLFGLTLVAAITVLVMLERENTQKEYILEISSETKAPVVDSGLVSKSDLKNSIEYIVVPVDVSPNSSEWKFDITINTHSVELEQDLASIVELKDEKGKSYKPVAWDGSPPGGHHRSGLLSFKSIQPYPKAISLEIKDEQLRQFQWELGY